MGEKLPIQKLRVRLLKKSVKKMDNAFEDVDGYKKYDIKENLGFTGRLYVAPPSKSPPKWLSFVQTGVEEEFPKITNCTNAAVLLLRVEGNLLAFAFGHGRHMLKSDVAVPDFGIKTALNSLQADSLKSIDSFTLEQQTIHKRSQASRASGIEVFGMDVSRDVLRAVTGTPRTDVSFESVSGCESTLAVSVRTNFKGLSKASLEMLTIYRKKRYRENFSWVDNVSRVNDPEKTEQLDSKLVTELKKASPSAYLAPPEPIDWERIDGFSYTHRLKPIEPYIEMAHYLEVSDARSIDLDELKKHKVNVYMDGESIESCSHWLTQLYI